MNTERYIWPVIIAVSLHSLLLLLGTEPVVIFPPGKTKLAPGEPTPVVDLIELVVDPSNQDDDGKSGGSLEPLRPLPDIPRKPPKEDIFRVEVTEAVVPIKLDASRTKIPDRPRDPGDGTGLRRGPPGIVNHTGLDRAPRATLQPAPIYPANMRSTGTSGSVTVEFVVDTTGRVVSADAVSWTQRDFVDPAVRAVLRWRFEPGTAGGRKVSFRMAVPIEFNAAY
jgi:protein TonB